MKASARGFLISKLLSGKEVQLLKIDYLWKLKINVMPTGQEYGQAMLYEAFIRRAYGYQNREMKNGADASLMANLMDAENGKSNVKHLGSIEKQFLKVVAYVEKAIDAFLKPSKKLKVEEKQRLHLLKNKLLNISSISDLLSIVQEALEITQPYK